jgi:hypothetical protein
MPFDFDRVVTYVREHGDEFDRARLELLVDNGPLLSPEQEQHLLAGQRPDGGWAPFWAPEYSSIDATCFRFAQAESSWIAFVDPTFVRASIFLRSRQRPDGSWEEDESVRELAPPWARPGESAPRLYLTANCGWWLANATLRNFVSADAGAQRAGTYLEQHLAEDGSLPSFLHAHWLAAGLWIRLGRNDLADRLLDYLTTRISDNVPASSLAWMLTTFAGLFTFDKHPLLIQKATTLLKSQQRADGSWESEDGPDRDPYVTVEALRGLIQWAAI